MENKEIQKGIVELYLKFQQQVVQSKVSDNGRIYYTDHDFDFASFIDWLISSPQA